MGKIARFLLVGMVIVCSCKKQPPPPSPAAPEPTLLDSKVILKIADAAFTNKDLKDYIRLQYSSFAKVDDEAGVLSLFYKQFVEYELVLFAIEREGITVSDEEISQYLSKLSINSGDEPLIASLARNTVKIQKYLASKVYAGIDASEAEMEKYYQEHLQEFNKAEEIFLYQILLDDAEKAIKVRSELENSPQRFEEIARRESKSLEAADGGKMGFFERGQLPQEMEDVVFSLKVGSISPVVKSPYGHHIFKVTKRRGAKRLTYFQVKPEIKDRVLSLKMGIAYQAFLDRAKADRPVEMLPQNLYFPYRESDGENK